MGPEENTFAELSREEYDLRLVVNRLRREVYQQPDPWASERLFAELHEAEKELSEAEKARAAAQAADERSGLLFDTEKTSGLLGAKSTGLEAKVHLRMAQVPTSICHLLDRDEHPVLTCRVRNAGNNGIRRLRVISFIDGYSADAVDTVELDPLDEHSLNQLPTLYPDRVRGVTELTRAALNVVVEDLDGQVELHKTEPIWLLARTTAPLVVLDPQTGEWRDMTPYLGAFVTPNVPVLMTFLRVVADQHLRKRLVGYQGSPQEVELQVRAIFDALKTDADVTYVNSVIDFNPDQGSATQRVRLPRESLEDSLANCIDGTVLFASLLEGISLSPAIVVIPGHAFLAWETWRDRNGYSNEWKYLETTMIGSSTFEEACASGERTAREYKALAESSGNPSLYRQWPLRVLRTEHGITPME